MKTLKTLILFSFLFVCGMNASADNKSNLIYNMDGSTLANYMKYNYKYDDQKRITESEALKWNAVKNAWTHDMCIRYAYEGKSITTTYYKWSNKKNTYILIPEMTITMDNPDM